MPATSYYIYYRVAPGYERYARERVDHLQATVAAAVGVRGRLMTKRGEPNLWMEVYESVSDAARFEGALHAALEQADLAQVLAAGSQRRVECFEG